MILRIALLAVLISMVAGCSSGAGPRMALPPQDIAAAGPPGTARAIFFNSGGSLTNPMTSDITVEVDGRTLPKLNSNEYAQIFVTPGEHQLVLRHWDVVWFTTKFTIQVEPEGSAFRVFTKAGANGYEVSDLNPQTIARNHKPVTIKESWSRVTQE